MNKTLEKILNTINPIYDAQKIEFENIGAQPTIKETIYAGFRNCYKIIIDIPKPMLRGAAVGAPLCGIIAAVSDGNVLDNMIVGGVSVGVMYSQAYLLVLGYKYIKAQHC